MGGQCPDVSDDGKWNFFPPADSGKTRLVGSLKLNHVGAVELIAPPGCKT